jgi:hypothetical protein
MTKTIKSFKKVKSSSYWYDQYDMNFDYLSEYSELDDTKLNSIKKSNSLYKLSAVRRAISNFVQIVTQKNIPVSFIKKSNSYTDGKSVVLSADVDDNFDVSVGLALHEGSHIILSDFELLNVLSNADTHYRRAKADVIRFNKEAIDKGYPTPYPNSDSIVENALRYDVPNSEKYISILNDIYLSNGKIGSKSEITSEILDTIKGLNNWIEDRRIDYYIYNSAPGYRDYYLAMYDHYFNDTLITKGLLSDEYTDETIENYMFRIINLTNESSSLTKLKGLKSIYQMLDLKNINRLETTNDSLRLAIDIVAEMLKYVKLNSDTDGNDQSKSKTDKGDGDNDPNSNDEGQSGEGSDDSEETDSDDNQKGGNGSGSSGDGNDGEETDSDTDTDGDGTAGNSKGKSSKSNLTSANLKQLAKKIQKQNDFINGNIKKKTVSISDLSKLEAIDESGSELVRVGLDYTDRYGVSRGVDCIVVKKLTDSLIKSPDFPFSRTNWNGDANMWAEDEVRKGIVLGTLLGKKLQIRGESRDTVYSRLKKGKIDKRMISSLGYDNSSVFYTNETESYKKANLHISIDYSGSMSGYKLSKSITTAVAITKACQMARNVNVQVSIRSTENTSRPLPYIVMVYDSRRDSFKDFCKYMAQLQAVNTTPEGLCFEAIQKQLIPTDNSVDSYFLNLSDGEPTYSISSGSDSIHYGGDEAATHTNNQIKKMRANGINVLSYFITEYSGDRFEGTSAWRIFKKCYDKDAKYVNVDNIMQIAKTLNQLFLKKS